MEVTSDFKQVGLARMAERMDDFGPIAGRLYDLAEADFERRFASAPNVTTSAAVYGGVEWERLAESTLRSNPKRRGGKILIDSGELRDSFKRGKPGNVASVAGSVVIFGSELKKAIWNNERRPMNPAHPQLSKRASSIITNYVTKGRK
jgi:hypothetical protein